MLAQTALATDNRPPPVPKGAIKTFGPYGPKYEVGAVQRQLANGDWLVRVQLIETGETFDYRFSDLLVDPEAI